MIIATIWCNDCPLGVELEEDEEPFKDLDLKHWATTGNFAFCRNTAELEDFIEAQKEELNGLTDAYWEDAKKWWNK